MNGPPHCPNFITFCKVENFYEIASSSNKKRGKEMASLKILKCLAESSGELKVELTNEYFTFKLQNVD